VSTLPDVSHVPGVATTTTAPASESWELVGATDIYTPPFLWMMPNEGISNDGTFFYMSGKNGLARTDAALNVVAKKMHAIPDALAARGCNHIGALMCSLLCAVCCV